MYFQAAAGEKDSFKESSSSSDSSSESEAEQEKEVTHDPESAKTENDKTSPEKDSSNESHPGDNNSERKPSIESNQTKDETNSSASNQKGSMLPPPDIVIDKCESDKDSVSTDAMNGNEEQEEPRPKTRLERRGDLDGHF